MSLRLVIVDDEPAVGRALGRTFRSRGFDVTAADSLAGIATSSEVWDCAVLDVELRDGNGVDLAAALLRRRQARCVIFYSGQSDPEMRRRAEAFGPFVSKMSGIDVLVETVETEVRRAASGMQSGTFESHRAKRRAEG